MHYTLCNPPPGTVNHNMPCQTCPTHLPCPPLVCPTGPVETEQTDNPQTLVFVSAEVAPWSKTGGLGDVIGALPVALAARGHRVMVVTAR